MPVLKGITWDHPRGYQPLQAIASLWSRQKGVELNWDVRSLRDFGDCPIEQLIGLYDLIIIDHPYVGSASVNKLLVPLDDHLPVEFIQLQRKESLGPGFESYWYADHCWALPIDAAAQVAAYRRDIVEEIKWVLPGDIMDLKYAASGLPKGTSIGVPLCPTDIWCVFLSLCALYSDGNFFSEKGIDRGTGEWAFDQISSWKVFLHKNSFSMNPIQMLEHMAVHDDIIYIPYTFGYTNYARKGWRDKLIHFCNGPSYMKGRHSSLLGGAGLSISSKTEYLSESLSFMQFALSGTMQKGIYFQEQGQPAHLSAWLDPVNNDSCSGFFSDTLDTMRNAYVRPRHNKFNRFQEMAADHMHKSISNNTGSNKAVTKLNSMYQNVVNE